MKRLILFGLGSIVGACIDFAIGYYLLSLGAKGWLALGLGMSVSVTVVYAIHQKLTFADIESHELNARRFLLFAINTATVFSLRVVVFELLIYFGLGLSISLALALTSSLVVNFAISRNIIFGSRRNLR